MIQKTITDIFAIVRFGTFSDYEKAVSNVDINVRDENGSNLLGPAIAYDRGNISEDLINRGIDIDHRGEYEMTPLHLAIQWKRWDLVRELIDRSVLLNAQDVYGNTALWYATSQPQRRYDIIHLLVKRGANPTIKNKADRSALDLANQIGDTELVQVLGGQIANELESER